MELRNLLKATQPAESSGVNGSTLPSSLSAPVTGACPFLDAPGLRPHISIALFIYLSRYPSCWFALPLSTPHSIFCRRDAQTGCAQQVAAPHGCLSSLPCCIGRQVEEGWPLVHSTCRPILLFFPQQVSYGIFELMGQRKRRHFRYHPRQLSSQARGPG